MTVNAINLATLIVLLKFDLYDQQIHLRGGFVEHPSRT
jgi:hypothetical protein